MNDEPISTRRGAHSIWLMAISVLLGAPVIGASMASTLDAQGLTSETVTIADPRPLAAAARQFEQRCHCVVTYEDPEFRKDQVESAAGFAAGPDTPLVPNGRSFAFTVSRDIAEQATSNISGSLQQMIQAFEGINGTGGFRAVATNRTFHIIPTAGSPLGAPITVDRGVRTLSQTLLAIAMSISTSSGRPVKLGTIQTALTENNISLEAVNEPGRDVLSRVLLSSGGKLSWRLLYDFGYRTYYLNIHTVQ